VDDPLGIELRDRIGIDIIMWESDYPHPDSTWPDSPEILWRSLAHCTPSEVDRVTHSNACRMYQFDPFAKRSRSECTVGARRAAAAGRSLVTAAAYTGADKTTSIFARSVNAGG
jgi:hypothetical protein